MVGTGVEATAIGSNAFAFGTGTTAVGANSTAGDLNGPGTGSYATAVGSFAFGIGLRSIAIGYQPAAPAGAFGQDSIAIGTNANAGTDPTGAPGANAIAIGNAAGAFADNSMALGAGTVVAAAHSNSTAIGFGAETTGANQMVFGVAPGNAATGAATSYYLPGLTGGAAPAAVNDALVSVNPVTGQVTVAPATVTATGLSMNTVSATTGNIGSANVTTAFNVSPGATINMGGNQVHGVATPLAATDAAYKGYVDAGLNQAFKRIDENAQGIAIALAMGGIYVPESKRFSMSGGYGTFDGANAFAAQMAVRVSQGAIVTGGVGVGLEHDDAPTKIGGRMGFQVSW